MTYRIDFNSIPENSPVPGLFVQSHRQGGRQIRLARFTKDFVEDDWCRKGHIGYVIEGELEVNFDGNVVTFKQGDGLFIPAGEQARHKARAVTDIVQVILVEDV